MSNYGIIIKDVKVPHTAYRSKSGLIIYSIPVDISIPDDLIGALRDMNQRYLERFDKDNKFSIYVRENGNSYRIVSREHHIGLRVADDSGNLYVPSELPEKSLYLLNELMRVFSIKPAKQVPNSIERTSECSRLSQRALADIEDAIRQSESCLSKAIIDFLEEAVSNF